MGFFTGLVQAAKESWHYISSAVRSEVESEVFAEIIPPISDIVDLRTINQFFEYYDKGLKQWHKLFDIPYEHIVSDEFSIETPFDYSREHVMKMKVQGIDINTGMEIDTWITVESDRNLSRQGWENLAQEAVYDSIMGYSYDVQYVAEYEYYKRVRD